MAGANDLGGTLGGDELSAASGAPDGVETNIQNLERLAKNIGRDPVERNTKYTEFYPIKFQNKTFFFKLFLCCKTIFIKIKFYITSTT